MQGPQVEQTIFKFKNAPLALTHGEQKHYFSRLTDRLWKPFCISV